MIIRKQKFADYVLGLSADDRKKFAEACGTKLAYIERLYRGHRNAGIPLAKQIREASNGALTLEDIRPDIFD